VASIAAGDETGGRQAKPRRSFARRLARRLLIGNLCLAGLLASAAVGAHWYAASSEDRFQSSIGFALRYVLTPASLVDEHGFNRETGERAARFIERLVVGSADMGPRSDAHQYFQARVLMALPASYKVFGRNEERTERAERAIRLLADLVARHPSHIDYRRRYAVSLMVHADDLADMGRHETSMARRHEAMAIADGLLRDQPGHWRWRWYIATSQLGIAKSLDATGQGEKAGPHREIARAMSRDLCQERPNDEFRLCELARQAQTAAMPVPPTR
jgi:hypothetical protein